MFWCAIPLVAAAVLGPESGTSATGIHRVTLPPEPGDAVQRTITVRLPARTPYRSDSPEEARYLKGYAEGYADVVRLHVVCRSRVGERAAPEWGEGWVAGSRAAPNIELPGKEA